MELLAPAGTIEVFETAVECGADAIYIGAPDLNARALAKSFSLAEIAALTHHAHESGVKVYVAMNSLLKDDEIPEAIKLLCVFSKIKIDAIIIQDLGLLYLAKKYFPHLRIHASTLMGVHNSAAMNQFAEMGFSRVVLAREMSLPEIAAANIPGVEIEVFIHGAMCFSVSGLCLFSSFLGGKSGLRGRCVQPCRRRYNIQGGSKSGSSGYYFSMNDLSGINYIEELKTAGVSSIKIEGRMRSRQYVGNVIKAYRLAIDNPGSDDAVTEAQKLISYSMGRNPAPGYFGKVNDAHLISHRHSGNIGAFVGKFINFQMGVGKIELKNDVHAGDRFRVHFEKSGERKSFTLKNITHAENTVNNVQKGELVGLELPFSVSPGDILYKVDTVQSRIVSVKQSSVDPSMFKNILDSKTKNYISGITKSLGYRQENKRLKTKFVQRYSPGGSKRNQQRRKKQDFKQQDRMYNIFSVPWWLKIEDFSLLKRLPQNPLPNNYICLLTDKTFSQIQKTHLPGKLKNSLIWSLPPVIYEDKLKITLQQIVRLYMKGFYFWQLSHIGQVELFYRAAEYLKREHGKSFVGPIVSPMKINNSFSKKYGSGFKVCANYSVNSLNKFSYKVLSDFNVGPGQVLIEADSVIISKFCQNSIGPVGMTVYGTPPLFTSRLAPDFFNYQKNYISPKNEKFNLVKSNDLTIACPDQPFSLLGYIDDIVAQGIDYLVVDLTGKKTDKAEIVSLWKILSGKPQKHKKQRLSTFNYRGQLL